MKRFTCIVVVLMLLFSAIPVYAVTESSSTNTTVSTVLKYDKGILTYGDQTLDFKSYEFKAPEDQKWEGFSIPAGVCGSGLASKPVVIGNYIYMMVMIFIPENINFDDSASYKNQQVKLGSIYDCLFQFTTSGLTPELIGKSFVMDKYGTPYDTTINEGDQDNMGGEGKMFYYWAEGRLTPQLIVSRFQKRLYSWVEWYNPVLKKVVYQCEYYEFKELLALKGGHEVFYCDSTVTRPTGGEPGKWEIMENTATEILVISYPKGGTGSALGWWLDISKEGFPNVTKTAKRPMKNWKFTD